MLTPNPQSSPGPQPNQGSNSTTPHELHRRLIFSGLKAIPPGSGPKPPDRMGRVTFATYRDNSKRWEDTKAGWGWSITYRYATKGGAVDLNQPGELVMRLSGDHVVLAEGTGGSGGGRGMF